MNLFQIVKHEVKSGVNTQGPEKEIYADSSRKAAGAVAVRYVTYSIGERTDSKIFWGRRGVM